MTWTTRISLPGYDALTDTNLDHFALYADQNNVLIKELVRGSIGILGNGSGLTVGIAHNLGYVPFFLCFVLDTQATAPSISATNNKWKLLAHNTAGASVPPYTALADSTYLYITNYLAGEAGTISFKYFIFYDVFVSGSTPSFTNTGEQISISQSGHNVLTDTNPNDYIFHSNLNTFKILKEANANISYTTDGVYTVAHGASISNPSSYLVFMKFPDGKTAVLPGKGVIYSYDSNWFVTDAYIDTTNIGMYIQGTNMATTLPIKFYVFETPLT
jgi:hypothetical protein